MTTDTKTIERVGILLVHGIGETKKFENIEAVARNIATALLDDPNLDVRVIINTSDNAGFRADQQIWLSDGLEPVIIEVKEHDPNDPDQEKVLNITQLCFREVWWADLGKSDTLRSQLSFWKWGLSLWSREQYLGKKDKNKQKKEGFSESDFGVLNQVHLPTTVSSRKTPNITLFDRFRFFVVSWVVLLVLPLLSFLSVILRKILGFEIRPDILVQYLGDIKHYQQEKREGAGYLIDLGQPPRISVRRRMVKGLVKMGLADYQRWYVLSHSLGTVVAFNGLMEPDNALPNYLNEYLWNEYKKNCKNPQDPEDLTYRKANKSLTEKQADQMFPSRPAWLELDDIISRKILFKNLKGFMTYGSPLSKFAVVWPAIVPINKDNGVFSDAFQWVNVYDPTDPVADKTKYFDLENYGGKPILEIAYKAESIHLLSHIKYLTYTKRKNPLVTEIAYWLLKGDDFQPARGKTWGWPYDDTQKIIVYQGIRYLIWVIAGLFISWVLGFLFSKELPDFMNWLSGTLPAFLKEPLAQVIQFLNSPIFSNPLLYFLGAAVIVFLFGFVVRAINGLSNRTDD